MKSKNIENLEINEELLKSKNNEISNEKKNELPNKSFNDLVHEANLEGYSNVDILEVATKKKN
ncbi:hypothetical protein FZ990_12355 [Clostridium perfringens]|nr:hypothetical protein [Clostridium perfringens]